MAKDVTTITLSEKQIEKKKKINNFSKALNEALVENYKEFIEFKGCVGSNKYKSSTITVYDEGQKILNQTGINLSEFARWYLDNEVER